jgi:hypothetical protein
MTGIAAGRTSLDDLSAVLGDPQPNCLKLMMKRLAEQGILARAARDVYVNPRARSCRTIGEPRAACIPASSHMWAWKHDTVKQLLR